MQGLAELYTTEGQPLGCAIFQGGEAGSPQGDASAVTQELKNRLQESLCRRFEGFAAAGTELAASPRTLAQFVLGTLCGISQLACDGAQRTELMKVVEHAARSCAKGTDTRAR